MPSLNSFRLDLAEIYTMSSIRIAGANDPLANQLDCLKSRFNQTNSLFKPLENTICTFSEDITARAQLSSHCTAPLFALSFPLLPLSFPLPLLESLVRKNQAPIPPLPMVSIAIASPANPLIAFSPVFHASVTCCNRSFGGKISIVKSVVLYHSWLIREIRISSI